MIIEENCSFFNCWILIVKLPSMHYKLWNDDWEWKAIAKFQWHFESSPLYRTSENLFENRQNCWLKKCLHANLPYSLWLERNWIKIPQNNRIVGWRHHDIMLWHGEGAELSFLSIFASFIVQNCKILYNKQVSLFFFTVSIIRFPLDGRLTSNWRKERLQGRKVQFCLRVVHRGPQ